MNRPARLADRTMPTRTTQVRETDPSSGQTWPMSPVSRGRKAKRRKSSGRKAVRPLVSVSDECACPACTGVGSDPLGLMDQLLVAAADLDDSEDPLDAEFIGAAFMSIGARDEPRFRQALIDGFIPEFEARASSAALSMLLAIDSVAEGRAGAAASAAADRLVRAGVPAPPWAAELRAPVTVGDCRRLIDSEETASILACSFHRQGRSHAVVIGVDHEDCGAADVIYLLDSDRLPDALETVRAIGRDDGREIRTETVDPAEFRWQVEQALDARAVHDSALSDEEMAELAFDQDGPGYPALAVLVRARMQALPKSGRPPAPHEGVLSPLPMLTQLAGTADLSGPGKPTAPFILGGVAALPGKRKRSGSPAPVYQIKVGLRGAKPPIWRRLEVPADISLARLHTVIQIAFGWGNYHLHVFETPYGSFGAADVDLGHSSDEEVSLEQVAPTVRSRLRYTYDFGDDWEHDILVEKVLDRNGTAPLPRCTGGRRATPPDDCGGILGYGELVEVLSDPADEEHEDMLEWLGLHDAAEFDPEAFDAGTVTRALSRVG